MEKQQPANASRIKCVPEQRRRAQSSHVDSITIDGLLTDLGYSSFGARSVARRVLEQARLTNPCKRNIHPRKLSVVRATLASRLRRTCGARQCLDAAVDDFRNLVTVERRDCETCGGRPTAAATQTLIRRLAAHGVKRLVVVGGSPESHTQLRKAFRGAPIRLDLVDGQRKLTRGQAWALADGADIVVIWGGTILSHAVSGKFGGGQRGKNVTVAKRGIEALVQSVVEHLSRAGARDVRD